MVQFLSLYYKGERDRGRLDFQKNENKKGQKKYLESWGGKGCFCDNVETKGVYNANNEENGRKQNYEI